MTTELIDDPFADMEKKAKREQAETLAAKAMSEARASLVISKDCKGVFFATLAMNLRTAPLWEIPTAGVDGRHLYYNPAWWIALSRAEQLGVLVHEVMHCANKHMVRQGERDHDNFNIACDAAINPLIVEAGYKLPDTGIFPGKAGTPYADWPVGLSAEEYYNLIPAKPPGGGGEGGSGGDGMGDPGGCGGVMKPKQKGDPITGQDAGPAAMRELEADLGVQVIQAGEIARQKSRGDLPGMIARLIGEIQEPKVPWTEVLREFISKFAKNDYSWSPPSRRFIHQGLYLPSLRSEEIGDIVLAVDTSGSIGQTELNGFAAEAQGILDAYSCDLTILHHDSAVAHVQKWQSTDGPLHLEPHGGGGTSHVCITEYIARENLEPCCLVCLTDCFTEYPPAPDYPTLWAVIGNEKANPPFGQVVVVPL